MRDIFFTGDGAGEARLAVGASEYVGVWVFLFQP